MGQIDTLIDVNISLVASTVTQPSFSLPLIIGPTSTSWGPTAFVHAYTQPSQMLADGFTTSSPEYIYALEMFEQQISPTEFFVGYRSTAAAQISTITVTTAVDSHNYTGLVAGQPWSFVSSGSATGSNVAVGIQAAIAALMGTGQTATQATDIVTLTANVAGIGFTSTSTDSNLTLATSTANNGIQNDINNILSVNNLWYGMCLCQGTDADIEQAASLIQSLTKIYIAVSSTAAIATTSSTDVASVLKGQSLTRTALIYTPEANEGKDAAWLGGQLPQTPGSNNWAYKTLAGCTPDNSPAITANEALILIGDPVAGVPGKNANIYQTIGGADVTEMGTMASGQFIDVTIGVDWLQATIQTNILTLLTSVLKVPYTDKGTAMLMQQIEAALTTGVSNGLIDGSSPITVTAPLVATVPQTQRANRISPTISFSCRFAGANNAVVVNGTVTF